MKHQAWDDGAILDSFADVFGNGIRQILTQKTTKTYCGKRVAVSQIANGNADCPQCKVELARRENGRLMLVEYDRVIREQGFEYANRVDWSKWTPGAIISQLLLDDSDFASKPVR